MRVYVIEAGAACLLVVLSMGMCDMLVCDLVFLSRYMRPEGPWQRLRRCLMQRRWLFLYLIPLRPDRLYVICW